MKCPICGCAKFTIDTQSNNIPEHNEWGQLIGYRQGVPTAHVKCESGCFMAVRGQGPLAELHRLMNTPAREEALLAAARGVLFAHQNVILGVSRQKAEWAAIAVLAKAVESFPHPCAASAPQEPETRTPILDATGQVIGHTSLNIRQYAPEPGEPT